MNKKHLNYFRKNACQPDSFPHIEHLDYATFFRDFLLPNKPCILTPQITENWKSRTDWVCENGTPNFAGIREMFGEATVPVANCKQEQYSSHPKQEMLMAEYLDYWEHYRAAGYSHDEPCLYLKDWHFTKCFPTYQAYTTPIYFQSDWLNEFWDTLPQDDYRFVYMGPKGTWTPFHTDVYRSYSWSANICGKKKWIFFPPGCEESLKDNLGNLVYDITSPELDNKNKFPNAHKVKGQMLEVIQGRGQIIFVPSGWHHQVFNLEDTVSINHNWLNGCNLDICWKHLQDNLSSVKREIEHCKDMEDWNNQCQLILKAVAGLDFAQFIHMLQVIAQNRIKTLQNIRDSNSSMAMEDLSRGGYCEKSSKGDFYEKSTKGADCDKYTKRDDCDKSIKGDYCDKSIKGDDCDKSIKGDYCDKSIKGDYCDKLTKGGFCDLSIKGDFSVRFTKEGSCDRFFKGEEHTQKSSQNSLFGNVSEGSVILQKSGVEHKEDNEHGKFSTSCDCPHEHKIVLKQDRKTNILKSKTFTDTIAQSGDDKEIQEVSCKVCKLKVNCCEAKLKCRYGKQDEVSHSSVSEEEVECKVQCCKESSTVMSNSKSGHSNEITQTTLFDESQEDVIDHSEPGNSSRNLSRKDSRYLAELFISKALPTDIMSWRDIDYIVFDLERIEEIIKDVISDSDYQSLGLQYEESAEFVLDLLKTQF